MVPWDGDLTAESESDGSSDRWRVVGEKYDRWEGEGVRNAPLFGGSVLI